MAAPLLGERNSPILLAWTTGGVEPGFAANAARLPGVTAVAEVRNGMGWLSSWAAEGKAAISAPAGYRVPVEIAAIDPAQYSKFIPAQQRSAFEQLAQGGALLGRTGAQLRGIEGNGTLQLGDVTVPVIGVVDDYLVASHEVVVSQQTAAGLGIDEPKYILIALGPEASASGVEEGLRRGLPPGKRLGTRTPDGDAPIFRPGGTNLPQVEVKKMFGEFSARQGRGAAIAIDPAWIQANTANVSLPLLGETRCHKAFIPVIRGALNDVVQEGLSSLVRKMDFGGCFAPRMLNSDPHSGLSRHAWGVAIDFNVSGNRLGTKPTMDPRLIEIMERWGLAWGGRWMVPDGMHFEYLKKPG
jgi:D-alanyl-D-alanine carboxypeptidase-like protein